MRDVKKIYVDVAEFPSVCQHNVTLYRMAWQHNATMSYIVAYTGPNCHPSTAQEDITGTNRIHTRDQDFVHVVLICQIPSITIHHHQYTTHPYTIPYITRTHIHMTLTHRSSFARFHSLSVHYPIYLTIPVQTVFSIVKSGQGLICGFFYRDKYFLRSTLVYWLFIFSWKTVTAKFQVSRSVRFGACRCSAFTSTLSLQHSHFNTLTSTLSLQHFHFNTFTSTLSLQTHV